MAKNFEVLLEMVEIGLSNPVSTVTTFDRTRIGLDTDVYDGATYYFEVVAYNGSGTAQTVTLYNCTHLNSAATVTVSASTTYTRYRSAAFVADSGPHVYAVQLPSISTLSALRINAARIVVVQADATKTRIQIPLTCSYYGSYFSTNDTSTYLFRQQAATYAGSDYYTSRWLYTAANWGTLTGTYPWRLEVVRSSSAADGTGTVALCQSGTTTVVTGSTVPITNDTIDVSWGDFEAGAANFSDGTQYVVKVKGDGTNYGQVYRAALYVTLDNLSDLEVYLRFAQQFPTATTDLLRGQQRLQLNSDNYDADTVTYYTEATGYCADDADAIIPQIDDSAFAMLGDDITDSGVNWNSGSRALLRTSSWTPPTGSSGSDVYFHRLATTNNSTTSNAFVVVGMSWTPDFTEAGDAEFAVAAAGDAKGTHALAGAASFSVTAGGTPQQADFNLFIEVQVADEGDVNVDRPFLTSVDPPSALPGETVIASGTNFGDPGDLWIGSTSYTYLTWGETSVSFSTPNITPGTYVLIVQTGTYPTWISNGLSFTVKATQVETATITSLLPNHGVAGSRLAISGTNFGTAGSVSFAGTLAAAPETWTDTLISGVLVPELDAGTYAVYVDPDDAAVSAGVDFTVSDYVAPDPDIFDGTLEVMIGDLEVTGQILPGLSWSNTNPGGFGEASFQLPAVDHWNPYDDAVVKGAAVTIRHGAEPEAVSLFEGEIINDVSHAVVSGDEAYFDIACAGLWWRAAQGGDFCRTWTDDDYSKWFLQAADNGPFTIDNEGKLLIKMPKKQSVESGFARSLYYWLDDGMGDQLADIEAIVAMIEYDTRDGSGATWHADLSSAEHPWSSSWTIEHSWSNAGPTSTPQTFYHGITAGHRALRLRLRVASADVENISVARYIQMTRLSVIARGCARSFDITAIGTAWTEPTITTSQTHRLAVGDRIMLRETNSTPNINGWQTVTYVDGQTLRIAPGFAVTVAGDDGVIYAAPQVDRVMADIAGDVNRQTATTHLASNVMYPTAGIGLGNWGLNVRPHMSRAEAIELLADTNEEIIDYGFWDDGLFTIAEPPDVPDEDTYYAVNAETPGIEVDLFQNVESAPGYVKVLYKFRDVDGGTSEYPDGTLRSVYVHGSTPVDPNDHWTDARVIIDVWDQWADLSLTTEQAENIGKQILAWLDDNQWQGTITISKPTVDTAAGESRASFYIRPGDYIEETTLGTGALRITEVQVDADSQVVTCTIGVTRDEFVARLDRQFWRTKKPRRRVRVRMADEHGHDRYGRDKEHGYHWVWRWT